MRGGVSTFVCLASLAATGCTTATQTADIKVRPLPDAADKLRPGSGLLADARAQLALGNVGLALEGFRKALREQPNSAEAYTGIAKAYEAMGRSDLARANYEAALALTPRDPQLLTAVAVALDEQGRSDAAAMARQEAASVAAPVEPALPQPKSDMPATVALSSSITVELPPARPAKLAALASTVAVDLSVPQPAPSHVEWTPLAPKTSAAASVTLNSSVTMDLPPARPAQLAALTPRVGVDLSAPPQVVPPLPEWAPPAPRTSAEAPVSLGLRTAQLAAPRLLDAIKLLASNVSADFSGPKPVPARRDAPPAEAIEPGRGPYLERLSPAEVALVTDGQPVWRPKALAQNRASTIVRWVPLMMADARPNVRILNAAQRQGLAAASRNVLLDRGWRKIAIGNADSAIDRSVVLYPASRRTLARSLAAQFGIPARLQPDANVLVVLLGRDAARRVSPPKRG
jgi:hypothetical protein